ncbi:MAG: CDP-alcohol phosphatidyltransferase family protein [Bacteroidota bacterium]
MTAERVWTASNIMSCSRILLLGPLAVCLFSEFENNRLWAGIILLIGAFTDFLDGYFARKYHAVSEFGKIMDPLADKIAVGAIAIFLVILGDVPLWYVVLALTRDGLIFAGGLYIRRKKNIIAQSNLPGKLAVSFIALFLLFSIVRWESLEDVRAITQWLSVVLMIVSLIVYGQRLFIGRAMNRAT